MEDFKYISPLGEMKIVIENNKIISIEFTKVYSKQKSVAQIEMKTDNSLANKLIKILNRYFAGEEINLTEINALPMKLVGTDFQKDVWNILLKIPYGQTTTYGEISDILRKKHNKPMSAQAVGGAVGKNPIPILIPCHRVVGKDNNLTGYYSGIERKIELFKIEKIDMSNMYFKNNLGEKIYVKKM